MRNASVFAAVAAAIVSLSDIAVAAPVSIDWKVAGDGLITQVAGTGLDWLDLSVTDNQSFNNVQRRLSKDLAGWRVATAPESEKLFASFGLPIEDSYDTNASAASQVTSLVAFMGDTFADYAGGYSGVYGFVDYSLFAGFHLQKGAFRDPAGSIRLYTANLDGHANDAIAFQHMGTFLVRDTAVTATVAEPSTVFLTGLALLAMFGFKFGTTRPRYQLGL